MNRFDHCLTIARAQIHSAFRLIYGSVLSLMVLVPAAQGQGLSAGMGAGAMAAGGLDPALVQSLREQAGNRDRDLLTGLQPEEAVTRSAKSPSSAQPAKPNQFQQFVRDITGERLNRYGQEFFQNAESFGSTAGLSTPVVDDYVIGPGDEVRVQVTSAAADFDQRFVVGRDGQIALPKIGPVRVAGVKASQLEAKLTQALSAVISNFKLYVTTGRLKGIEVYVVGQAARPGKIVISSLTSLANAVLLSGGPGPEGSYRNIQLIRNGRPLGSFDLYDFLALGRSRADLRLIQGDTIQFSPVGPQIALMGAGARSAIFELPKSDKEFPADQLLSLVGGASGLQADRLVVERLAGLGKGLLAQEASLSGLSQIRLKDGDLIRLLPLSPEFDNAVTFRVLGEAPIRLPVKPGERVADFLPNRVPLLTRGFYQRRNSNPLVQQSQSGFGFNSDSEPRSSAYPDQPARSPGQDALNYTNDLNNPQALGSGAALFAGAYPNRSANNAVNANGLPLEQDPLRRRRDESRMGLAGPMASDYAEQRALVASTQANRFKEFSRNAANAGANTAEYSRLREFLAEEEINWEQAVVERLNKTTMRTEVLSFSLLDALARNPDANLTLQPGDIVTILRRAEVKGPSANATRIVRIQGEVKSPGIYQLKDGETLEGLIQRAGGLTSQAYAFGTQLRRLSVYEGQKQQVAQLARNYETRAIADLRSEDSRLDLSSESAIQARQLLFSQNLQLIRDQASRIARLEPSGRMALEMDPSRQAFPEILLEDADEVMVPPVPSHVQVAGAVVNENVLRYGPGLTVRRALLAAGVLPSADVRQAFIARADGSVSLPLTGESASLLRTSGLLGGWFSGDLEVLDAPLMPGDTVVVPEKPIRESGSSRFVRNLKDYTQIFAQLGLGLAAVRVLNK